MEGSTALALVGGRGGSRQGRGVAGWGGAAGRAGWRGGCDQQPLGRVTA